MASTMTAEEFFAVLKRRWLTIAAVAVLVTVAAFVILKQEHPSYTATASVVFESNQASAQVAGVTPTAANQATQETDVDIVALGNTAALTAKAVGDGFTEQKIKDAISASSEGLSNVVQVSATARSPALAARIANVYTSLFVSGQAAQAKSSFAEAQLVVERQLDQLTPAQRKSGEGLDLQTRAQTLAELAQLQAGSIQVAQKAQTPTVASSPKIKRYTILAALVGVILGLVVALIVDKLDTSIREPEDLEAIFELPLLGMIPKSPALSRQGQGNASQLARGISEDMFNMLRARLRYFSVGREVRVVVVVSAAPGDGKSTVSFNLAMAAARLGGRVLLIEADLRRPSLAEYEGLRAGPGLVDVLVGTTGIADAVQVATARSSSDHASGGPAVDVLVAGRPLPPNPGQLLESGAMSELLATAREGYDLILVDTPPLPLVPDAFPLLKSADGVLVVGRVGRRDRGLALRLKEMLDGSQAFVFGVVANGLEVSREAKYGYGYGYHKAGDRQELAEESVQSSE